MPYEVWSELIEFAVLLFAVAIGDIWVRYLPPSQKTKWIFIMLLPVVGPTLYFLKGTRQAPRWYPSLRTRRWMALAFAVILGIIWIRSSDEVVRFLSDFWPKLVGSVIGAAASGYWRWMPYSLRLAAALAVAGAGASWLLAPDIKALQFALWGLMGAILGAGDWREESPQNGRESKPAGTTR